MELPGGVLSRGELLRSFAFKPVTGELEMSVFSCNPETAIPVRVTTALTAALEHIGGEAVQWRQVHGISVGDRQFLVRQLGAHLDCNDLWLNIRCATCERLFDLRVRQAELPVKPAGEGFPFVDVETSLGPCRFRVPNGEDQETIAALAESSDARQVLAMRLVVEPEDLARPAFSEHDLEVIDRALEDVVPEPVIWADTACPECSHPNRVDIDPYTCLFQGDGELLAEVHVLASTYHWHELDILALPRSRRQKYLRLIDHARGMTQ